MSGTIESRANLIWWWWLDFLIAGWNFLNWPKEFLFFFKKPRQTAHTPSPTANRYIFSRSLYFSFTQPVMQYSSWVFLSSCLQFRKWSCTTLNYYYYYLASTIILLYYIQWAILTENRKTREIENYLKDLAHLMLNLLNQVSFSSLNFYNFLKL